MGGLEVAELADQRVVVGVGDGRGVELVVALVVAQDLGPQGGGAGRGIEGSVVIGLGHRGRAYGAPVTVPCGALRPVRTLSSTGGGSLRGAGRGGPHPAGPTAEALSRTLKAGRGWPIREGLAPRPPIAPDAAHMALNGSLDDYSPAGALRVLSSDGRTGAVRFAGKGGCTVYLHEGQLYFARGDGTDDALASALVRPGRLTAEMWTRAVDEAGDSPRVGELLIDHGSIDPDLLASVALSVIYDPLITLFREGDGQFEFEPDTMHWIGAYRGFNVEAIVNEVRRRVRGVDEMSEVVPSVSAWVSPRRTLPNGAAQVTLLREDWELVTALSGPRTVIELAASMGRGQYSTAAVVHRLARAGLLEVVAEPFPADAPDGALHEPSAAERMAAATTAPDEAVDRRHRRHRRRRLGAVGPGQPVRPRPGRGTRRRRRRGDLRALRSPAGGRTRGHARGGCRPAPAQCGAGGRSPRPHRGRGRLGPGRDLGLPRPGGRCRPGGRSPDRGPGHARGGRPQRGLAREPLRPVHRRGRETAARPRRRRSWTWPSRPPSRPRPRRWAPSAAWSTPSAASDPPGCRGGPGRSTPAPHPARRTGDRTDPSRHVWSPRPARPAELDLRGEVRRRPTGGRPPAGRGCAARPTG